MTLTCECGKTFPEPKGPWAGKIPCPECRSKLDPSMIGVGTMDPEYKKQWYARHE